MTGANRGIGLELARALAEAGRRVVATARTPGSANSLVAISQAHPTLGIEPLDVTSETSVAEFVERLGDLEVGLLINNAAVGRPSLPMGLEGYRQAFEVNALGALRVTDALLDRMRLAERRVIVNITSQLGSMELNEGGGYHAYRVSKAALNMITRTQAAELGREGFVCTLIHPGWVRTDMGGASAPVSPEESAAGILRVIDHLTAEDNGRFLNWLGETLPW